nr:MAG TPA: hypothetical protein [Bacteriophage sp.]
MNILQRHTAAFFGGTTTIKRSGKVIYTARRRGSDSDLGLYANGRQLKQQVNYSTRRKSEMTLLQRVLER